MTKKVYFVRHALLKPPYHNYSLLDLSELDALAAQEVDPHIDSSTHDIGPDLSEFLSSSDSLSILSATSNRCLQTCQLLLGFAKRKASVEVTPLLDEVMFRPGHLVSKAMFQASGMAIVREQLFRSTLDNSHASESVSAIYDRISLLEQLIRRSPEGNVLCVTHGFLMRFLQLYFNRRFTSHHQVTLDDLMIQINYPNLAGFAIDLDKL